MLPKLTTYPGHRFLTEIINHAVCLYHMFSLSLRDIELILAERGVLVRYESIRRWCQKFGADYAGKCGAISRVLATPGTSTRCS